MTWLLPADWGGEVGVEGSGQAVVVVLWWGAGARGKIQGLHHASGCHDAHQAIEVPVSRPLSLVQRRRKCL